MFVADQIHSADVAKAAALGVTLIMNNYPDNSSPPDVTEVAIKTACRAAGLDYRRVPIAETCPEAIYAVEAALASANGKVLAYSKDGLSATIWSMVGVRQGADCDALIASGTAAGYILLGVVTWYADSGWFGAARREGGPRVRTSLFPR